MRAFLDWLGRDLNRIVVVILTAVLLLTYCTPVRATQLDQHGCMTYAMWSRDLVWARDVGADLGKVRQSLTDMQGEDASPIFTLLLRDLDRLWATKVSRTNVMLAVYNDCAGRRGAYGTGA